MTLILNEAYCFRWQDVRFANLQNCPKLMPTSIDSDRLLWRHPRENKLIFNTLTRLGIVINFASFQYSQPAPLR